MPSLNNARFAGHLGRDVEMRFSKAGKAVSTFSLGVSSSSGAGADKKEDTYWANVVCFGKTAEIVSTLKKGHPVYAEGRMTEEKWTDKEGKEHRTTKLVAFHAWPLLRAEKAQPDTGEAGQQASAATDAGDDDSQIPF